jgi:transcriptional regulator ATRX
MKFYSFIRQKINRFLVYKNFYFQAEGIKFMWDACFESLKDAKNSKGSGCILAHCMGLGKSFQVYICISLLHFFLNIEKI